MKIINFIKRKLLKHFPLKYRESKGSDKFVMLKYKNLFTKILKEQIDQDLTIPDKFEYNKVYNLESNSHKFNQMRNNWEVSFIITNKIEPFLDYYAIGDDYSVHNRINSHGELIKLENYEGQFGRPVYPDDPERTKNENEIIQNHNDKVHDILKNKGLEK